MKTLSMNTASNQPSPLQISSLFGCDEGQVRAQFAKNAKQLGDMAKTAKRIGKKVNGYTANALDTLASNARIKSQLRVALKPGTIYSADNGELICANCAGYAAKFTGRDRSGLKVVEMTMADSREWELEFDKPLSCERGCTKYARSRKAA